MTTNFPVNDWFHIVACSVENKKSDVWKTFGCAGLGDPRLLLIVCDFAFGDKKHKMQKYFYERDVSKLEKTFIKYYQSDVVIHFCLYDDNLRSVIFTHGSRKTIEILNKIYQKNSIRIGQVLYYIMLQFDSSVYLDMIELIKNYDAFASDVFYGHIFEIYESLRPYLIDKNHFMDCIRIGLKTTYSLIKEYKKPEKPEENNCVTNCMYHYHKQPTHYISFLLLYTLVIIGVELFYDSREEIMKLSGYRKNSCYALCVYYNSSAIKFFPKFLKFATEFEYKDKYFKARVEEKLKDALEYKS